MAKKKKDETQRSTSMGKAAAERAWFSFFKPKPVYTHDDGSRTHEVKDQYKSIKKAFKHFKNKFKIEVPGGAGRELSKFDTNWTFGKSEVSEQSAKRNARILYGLQELENRFQAKFKASLKQQSAIRGRIQARKEAAQRARYKIGRKPIRPVLGGGSAPRFYPETMTRDTGVQY